MDMANMFPAVNWQGMLERIAINCRNFWALRDNVYHWLLCLPKKKHVLIKSHHQPFTVYLHTKVNSNTVIHQNFAYVAFHEEVQHYNYYKNYGSYG